MPANDITTRALDLCRRYGRPFPAELKAYASAWQRQRYDLDWCWALVKSALSERRPLWQVEAEVHRHHARLQSEKDARDVKAGEPLTTAPAPVREGWSSSEVSKLVLDTPNDPDRPPARPGPRQTHPAPRQPYRKRTGTKAHKVRELLKAKVIRGGSIEVVKLELIAKGGGLLGLDQEISRSSTFRRVMKELGIESHRIGFGRGAEYVWRLKPPAWTRGLGVHE